MPKRTFCFYCWYGSCEYCLGQRENCECTHSPKEPFVEQEDSDD